jgi:NADH:ubiquinone oxidoreductase subunit 6 (subunit J)
MSHVLFLDETSPSRWQALGAFLREFWPMLAPAVLGFIAIYFLLPQARRSRPAWAGAVGLLALVFGAALVLHREPNWAETILFYGFALIAVLGGGLMITFSNPVYAALSFALVVLSTCGLFLLQAAPFLMAATIIVYAGAIVVTFLFVIMLAQQQGHSNADLRSREPFLASLAGFVLMAALLCVLHRAYNRDEPQEIAASADSVRRAANAGGVDDVYAALGDPAKAPITERRSGPVVVLQKYLPDSAALDNLETKWNQLRPDADAKQVQAVREDAAAVLREVHEHYRAYGLGGPPAGWATDAAVLRPALPADNVTALGQSLFTDYLVPVELAAVLLLAATIGAIAIAGRRSEELR